MPDVKGRFKAALGKKGIIEKRLSEHLEEGKRRLAEANGILENGKLKAGSVVKMVQDGAGAITKPENLQHVGHAIDTVRGVVLKGTENIKDFGNGLIGDRRWNTLHNGDIPTGGLCREEQVSLKSAVDSVEEIAEMEGELGVAAEQNFAETSGFQTNEFYGGFLSYGFFEEIPEYTSSSVQETIPELFGDIPSSELEGDTPRIELPGDMPSGCPANFPNFFGFGDPFLREFFETSDSEISSEASSPKPEDSIENEISIDDAGISLQDDDLEYLASLQGPDLKRFYKAADRAFKKLKGTTRKNTASPQLREFVSRLGDLQNLVQIGLTALSNVLAGDIPSCLDKVYCFLHVAYAMSQANKQADEFMITDMTFKSDLALFRRCLSSDAELQSQSSEQSLFDELVSIMWNEFKDGVSWIYEHCRDQQIEMPWSHNGASSDPWIDFALLPGDIGSIIASRNRGHIAFEDDIAIRQAAFPNLSNFEAQTFVAPTNNQIVKSKTFQNSMEFLTKLNPTERKCFFLGVNTLSNLVQLARPFHPLIAAFNGLLYCGCRLNLMSACLCVDKSLETFFPVLFRHFRLFQDLVSEYIHHYQSWLTVPRRATYLRTSGPSASHDIQKVPNMAQLEEGFENFSPFTTISLPYESSEDEASANRGGTDSSSEAPVHAGKSSLKRRTNKLYGPYKCPYLECHEKKGYARKQCLERHIEARHSQNVYENMYCSVCNAVRRGPRAKDNMQTHIKTDHPGYHATFFC